MRSYFMWLCVFAFASLLIYDVKYSVKDAHKVTVQMEAELLRERQRLSILEVEWAMLTRPERIKAMVAKHLPELVAVNGEATMAKPSLINQVRLMQEQEAIWLFSSENSSATNDNEMKNTNHLNVNQIITGE